MSPSAKIVSFAVLTFFLLGFSTLMQQGAFVVPFPLIPEFTLAMAAGIMFQEVIAKRKIKLPFVLLFVYALLGTLSGQLFLETCFSLERIIWLQESGLIDLMKLIQLLVFIPFLVVFASGFASRTMQFTILALCAAAVIIYFQNNQLLIYGCSVCLGIVALIGRNFKKETQIMMPILVNFILGLALINLLSIVSISIY